VGRDEHWIALEGTSEGDRREEALRVEWHAFGPYAVQGEPLVVGGDWKDVPRGARGAHLEEWAAVGNSESASEPISPTSEGASGHSSGLGSSGVCTISMPRSPIWN